MSELVGLLILVFLIFLFYKIFKPYFLHYDNAILFTGGIGSGKSLQSVRIAKTCYKKNCYKVMFHNFKERFKCWFLNLFKKEKNKPKLWNKPEFYSNMPVKIGRNKFCKILTKDHITLKTRIELRSVVLIDEMSKVANQYNWNIDEVCHHLDEFIGFFRHYTQGGYLITNAQCESEVVKQVRSKLNSEMRCFDFHKYRFIYRVRILHCRISENQVSMSTDFIEDNTKWTYGLLLGKAYDTYYLSERYNKVKDTNEKDYTSFKYNEIMRFENYESRCDD